MSFPKGARVRHVKTGGIYRIMEAPDPRNRLEYCDEEFYVYRASGGGGSPWRRTRWYRSKSEMEDGRFALVESPTPRR